MKVVVSAHAAADLLRLRQFLAEKIEPAAHRSARVLIEAIDSLATYPARGRRVEGSLREIVVPFGNSGYVIRYGMAQEDIVVIRIWHAREDRS